MSKSIPLFILYGSATGNSEQIAKALSASLPKSNPPLYTSIVTCEGNSFRGKCIGYWNREPTKGKYPVVVVTSTTGNGEAPENIGRFVRYLKRKDNIAKQPLKNVCFAVLGLGDTNYDCFCASGKLVDKKMKECGGVQVKKVTMADEATGLEDVVEPWSDEIISFLERGCGRFDEIEEKKEEQEVVVTERIKNVEKKVDKVNANSGEVVADEKKEETKSTPQDKDISNNAAIQELIELSQALNITIPSSIPEKSLPSLLPNSESTNGLQESSLNNLPRPRAASFSTISSTSSGCHYNLSNPYQSPILSARYLTNTNTNSSVVDISSSESYFNTNNSKDMKRVLELTIGLPDDIIPIDFFQPGDSIGLVVDNRYTTEYSTLMSIFKNRGLDITKEGISLHSNDKDSTCSIQDGFLKVDITSPVKKRILLHMSQETSDSDEAHYLKLLSSKVGCNLYDSYIIKQQRNIVDILVDFPSCTPSAQLLYELSCGIAPRYYSVASSPYEVNVLKIALSVVDYTIGSRRRHGLASTYLEIVSNPLLQKQSSDNTTYIQIFPKPPSTEALFRLPTNPSKPLILIGPGTGISPFVGFITHLQKLDEIEYQREQDCNEGDWRGMDIHHEEQSKQLKSDVKKNVHVYFGCRWSNHDYLYKSELMNYQNKGYITQLNTAFSRDDNQKKTYVQDLVKLDEEKISNLILEQDAYIYICGDGSMAKDVQACLINVCKKDEKFLVDMKQKKKLVLDVWS